MRFDDRLLTVLNQAAEDRHDVAVRWRQLVDLVARAGGNGSTEAVSQALEEIRREAGQVDETLRAAAARAVAALPLPLGLLRYFVSESLPVSAPVLAAATLNDAQWTELHAAANAETRAFIDALHPRIPMDPHADRLEPEPAGDLAVDNRSNYVPPALHDVVERIEERRRMRAGEAMAPTAPPPADPPALFRWECGSSGEIAWVDGAPRGGLIGRSIGKPPGSNGDSIDDEVLQAFAARAPFRDGLLTVANAGTVSGAWKISGVPAFEPVDGRFAGYRGVALREVRHSAPVPWASMPDVLADPASLRELVHEIKTPLNAIIGFAEIIEGQYLGPADRSYRNRAGEIVRQARLLLSAVDDLDFAAKLHSAMPADRERLDVTLLLEQEASRLHEIASAKGVHLELVSSRAKVLASVQPELADRLLVRLFGAVADQAGPGERLKVSVDRQGETVRILLTLPNGMRELKDADLFAASPQAARAGSMFRLTRGLAQIAGGELVLLRGTLALLFPKA